MTLLHLSNLLQNIKGFKDIFDFTIDGDILDIPNNRGSFANTDGSIIVEFDILKLDKEDSHMDTTIKLTSHKNIEQIAYESCKQLKN